MTKQDYTHILAIVDRSGSMTSVATEMAGALNTFFSDQAKLPGVCKVDYVQFDDRYERVFKNTLVADAKAVIEARGMTALLDALGRAVTELGDDLANLPESDRPGKVLVAVVTDGHENASHEWTTESITNLVRQQEDQYNWEFVFLGANMDAVATAARYGFKTDSALTFATSNVGAAASSLSTYATAYRSTGAAKFTEADREANSTS